MNWFPNPVAPIQQLPYGSMSMAVYNPSIVGYNPPNSPLQYLPLETVPIFRPPINRRLPRRP
jgi:hypothetical protein